MGRWTERDWFGGGKMENNCISECVCVCYIMGRWRLQSFLAHICALIPITASTLPLKLDRNNCEISKGTYRSSILFEMRQSEISVSFHSLLLIILMRAMLSNKSFSPFRISNRKRIRSVQVSTKRVDSQLPQEEHLLRKLEKGLTHQYNNQENLFETNTSMLSDSEPVKVENKLWKYFVSRMQAVREKVEKERVNFCEKELASIKEEVYKKINFHRAEVAVFSNTIKTKNEEILGLFEDIKNQRIGQENINNQMKAKRRKVQEVPETNHAAKIASDKQKIEVLRTQIARAEQSLQQHQHSLLKIEEQWKSFLRHFLHQGFYFQNGVVNILKEMLSISYQPTKDDFPAFLDDSQKRSLLIEYDRLKQQATLNKNKSRSFVKSTQVSESKEIIRSLVKRENLLKIYDGTRSYMSDWLKNEVWKEEINLPRIQSTKQTISSEFDWRAEERRRLMFIDDKERYDKVRSILFGSKVETIT